MTRAVAVALAVWLAGAPHGATQEPPADAAPPPGGQESPAPEGPLPPPAAAESTGAAATAGAEPKGGRMLEEIVVTARRREENLQDVPVAVTGLGAEELQNIGVRNITDLQSAVPGLQFGESGAKTPSIFIRGIGQREGNAVLDPGVGVYINDVFIPRQDAQLLDTVDTESIQVLRGPQGTLFGKNTTGGAILITTRKPDTEHYDGAAGVRLGSFGRRDILVRGNAPLVTGSMAARFALNVTHQDGYLENELDGADFGDEDRISAATRWMWNPAESVTTELFGYWSRQHERGTAITCIHQNPASNLSQVDWPARPDFEVGCRRSEEVARGDEVSLNTGTSFTRMSTGILALTTDWVLEPFEVKSVTGLNYWWDIERNDDQDATAITILSTGTQGLNETLEKDGMPTADEKRYQVSEELRLQSSAFAERLKYTVGAFGSIERVRDFPFTTLVGPNGLGGIRPSTVSGMAGFPDLGPLDDSFRIPFPTLLGTRSDLGNDGAAFFAQGSYDVTDWFQATVGARYTWEHRTRDLTTIDVDLNAYCPRVQGAPLGNTGLCSPITVPQFDALGEDPPTLPLIVRPSADVRSESWSEFTPSVTLSVNAPEAWIEGRADSLLAYFTYSTGFKAGGFEPRGDVLVSFDPETVTNFEVGFKSDLVDRRLRLNAAGYHLSYDDIQVRVAEQGPMITDIFLFLSNASAAQVTGGEMEATLLASDEWLFHATAAYTWARYQEFLSRIVIPGQGEAIADRSEEPFALVPKATLSLAAEYHWETALGLVAPRLSYYFRDKLFTGIDEKAIEYRSSFIDAVGLLGARLTWFYGEHLRVATYVNNLLDEEYFASGFAVSALLGAATLVQGPQRAFGVELAYEF